MTDDFEIGRVVAVDTAQVTIELNKDLRSMTRSTHEGVQEVGRINTYVVIPVGAHRLLAMVTRVLIAEEAEITADRTMVTLPTARRLIKATLVGTIDGSSFTQGVSLFPVLDNPVLLCSKQDLDTVFDCPEEIADPGKPGYCITVGDAALLPGRAINVDPDAFFGKHAAILGSTGAGKSCTISAIIQSLLSREEIARTNFVILDTNGEYRTAFQTQPGKAKWESIANTNCLYIPSDPREQSDRLVIPYWFLNADDFVRLFRASPGVQRPVLVEALRLTRNEASNRSPSEILREEILLEINRMFSLAGSDQKTAGEILVLSLGLLAAIEEPDYDEGWAGLEAECAVNKESVIELANTIKDIAANIMGGQPYPKMVPADSRLQMKSAMDVVFNKLSQGSCGAAIPRTEVTADTPRYFDRFRFRARHIEQVLRREESGGPRARDYSGTMLLRIDRLMSDGRYGFLMGPQASGFPDATHSLAAFIRDVLGLPSRDKPSPGYSTFDDVPKKTMPFYDRQRSHHENHNVTIIDLSLLSAEVLENVTALIGRLILEFLQRLGEYGDEFARGSLPIVLVLEEAQNYIQDQRLGQEESVSRDVFERIA
ncbi:MAG: DUF87 domain-containing protein, partial [Chloroflexota bacterium]